MEEKILIKSERYNIKKLFRIFIIVGLLISLLMYSVGFIDVLTHEHNRYCEDKTSEYYYDICPTANAFIYVFARNDFSMLGFIPFPLFTVIGYIVYASLRSYELVVTDKRIYGTVKHKNRVDLPLDSVSAISKISFWRGIRVSTSSGKISFKVIKNAAEIYQIMNRLLIERQQGRNSGGAATYIQKSDEADQIKKYKDLLDSGVISQEEFDAKKKQLLGL